MAFVPVEQNKTCSCKGAGCRLCGYNGEVADEVRMVEFGSADETYADTVELAGEVPGED